MTAPDPKRRRLLGGLAALAGLAGAGAVGLSRFGSSSSAPTTTAPIAAPTTTTTTITPPSTTSTISTTTTTTTAPLAVTIAAICRDAWGAAPAREFRTHTIERLTVHHTAALLIDNADAPAHVRQHQRYHIGLGWPDLAYHFIIDANGHVYEGRPVDAVGDTGTDYDPTGHFLVCAEGNFNEQDIPPAQVDAVVDVLAWAATEFDVSPDTIRGHRDWAATTCPGDRFYPLVAAGDLMRSVEQRITSGGAGLEVVCGGEAVDLVAAIEAGEV